MQRDRSDSIRLSRRWLATLLDSLGAGPHSQYESDAATLPERCSALYAQLSRRERRSLRRRVERGLECEVKARKELGLGPLQRRRLVSSVAAALLGFTAPGAATASIQVVDDVDFEIHIFGVDDVSVDCVQGLVQVSNDSGQTQTANTECKEVDSLLVQADYDADSKTVDLSAMLGSDFLADPSLTVTMGGGDDAVTGGDVGFTITMGDGNDRVELSKGNNTANLGAGDDFVALGGGGAAGTVTLGGGADVVEADFSSQSSLMFTVVGEAQDAAIDQFTVTGDSFANTLTGDDFAIWQAGATVSYSGLEQVTIMGGDEPGRVGDVITSNFTGGFDVLIDGGLPNVAPGDTIYLSDPNTPITGFEQVIFKSAVPAMGTGGAFALAAAFLGGAWLRLRKTFGGAQS